MHSFHQSRGRIFFEVLCALAVSASCVGAWMQTGASAMLPAAAVALLYGMVRAFDMPGRRLVAPNRQKVEVSAEQLPDVAAEHPVTDEQVCEAAEQAHQAQQAQQAAPPARSRQRKAPRKTGSPRSGAAKAAKVVELVPVEEMKVAELVPDDPPETFAPMPLDDAAHASLAPLFEAEPFVRQQRTVFGRKAG